jgi:hypothetical protein
MRELWESLDNHAGVREMNSELKTGPAKKPYEPPKLATISLRPEEAVLGHCKILGGGGGLSGICSNVPFCVNFGS